MKSLNELEENKEKDLIINIIMKSKGLYCLIALPKVGKSLLALQISDCISNNKQFLGFDVNPSPVLYISTENYGNQLYERTNIINIKLNDNKFKYIDRLECPNFYLIDMELDIKDFSENMNGKLVIIDMLKDIQFDFNYDINSYQDIGQKVLPKLRELCNKYNFSILFIHHLNKKGKSLGSTALDSSVDGILKLKQCQDDKNKYILSIKNRDFPSVDLVLRKNERCILNLTNEDSEENIDYNLMLFVKYVASKGNIKFTSKDIVKDANLQLTPKQFDRLLNSNIKLLEKEGIYITKNRSAKERLYTAYYNYQEDKVKPTTLKTYRDRIKYMQLLDNIKLKDLSVKHYELWRKEINKADISTAYKNDIQKFIKIVLNWGSKMYDFDFRSFYNKITKFINHNELKKEMDFYTLEEFKQFISCENDLKFKCLYETLYYCGLRRGEARALTWNDINLEEKQLRVNKNIVQIGNDNSNTYTVTTPKTKSSIRTIPIAETLLNDLKMLFEKEKKNYGFKKSWYIFGSDVPITNSRLRDRKIQICKKAEIKEIRIHDFRHSCAALLINNGANITIVAKYLGHTKIDETLNTYSHMYKNKLNDVVDTINKLI